MFTTFCAHQHKLLAITFLGLLLFLPSLARAQGDSVTQQAEQAVKTLSTPSQEVIEKLSGLNHLPAEEWRFHAGDVEHGEAVDLDDSSWPIVKAACGRSERSGVVSPHGRSAEDLATVMI